MPAAHTATRSAAAAVIEISRDRTSPHADRRAVTAHARTLAVVLMNMGGPATVSAYVGTELIDTRLARAGPRSIENPKCSEGLEGGAYGGSHECHPAERNPRPA